MGFANTARFTRCRRDGMCPSRGGESRGKSSVIKETEGSTGGHTGILHTTGQTGISHSIFLIGVFCEPSP